MPPAKNVCVSLSTIPIAMHKFLLLLVMSLFLEFKPEWGSCSNNIFLSHTKRKIVMRHVLHQSCVSPVQWEWQQKEGTKSVLGNNRNEFIIARIVNVFGKYLIIQLDLEPMMVVQRYKFV